MQPANPTPQTGHPLLANSFGPWLVSTVILTVILAAIIAATQQQATTTVETPTRPTLGHHATDPAPAELDFETSSLATTKEL